MDASDNNTLIALITTGLLLCCCCLVLIGAGAGAFFYMRRNRKPAAPSASGEQPASFVPTLAAGVRPAPADLPVAETIVGAPPSPFSSGASQPPAEASDSPPEVVGMPAQPVDPEDIRARLLDLNGPAQPYLVQATGYKIAMAPLAVTGYLLEISFDYVDKVARFVEINAASADPRLKTDARQVLEAHGWTVRG